jgi:hypothetical protein
MNDVTKKNISELFADGAVIDRALKQAVQEALLLHRQRGVPIVIWRDGRVVWVPADEIPLPPVKALSKAEMND